MTELKTSKTNIAALRRRLATSSNVFEWLLNPIMLAFLFFCFMAQLSYAASDSPWIVASSASVSVGDTFDVRVENVPAGSEVGWSVNANVERTDGGKDNTRAMFKARAAGRGVVRATIDKLKWKGSITVDIQAAPKVKVKAAPKKPGPTDARDGAPPPKVKFTAKDIKVQNLLKKYKPMLKKAGLHDRFARQSAADEDKKSSYNDAELCRLKNISKDFMKDMHRYDLDVRDLQAFKRRWKENNPSSGDVLDPGGKAWDIAFLGTERALIAGRNEYAQDVIKRNLKKFFKKHPEAIGIVYGKIDIGSWPEGKLKGLDFAADVDFSTASADKKLNLELIEMINTDLKADIRLDMIQSDLVGTAHGDARGDVFIGHWGQTWAELDMLKRTSWECIDVEIDKKTGKVKVDNNGDPIIRFRKRAGADLFLEHAVRSGKPVEFPKMDCTKEPMLSMEMMRHAVHDVQEGPFRKARQLVKMLKYADRSYFMNKKALSEFGWNPYSTDPDLAKAAGEVTKHKNDPQQVAKIIEKLIGQTITEKTVNDGVNKVLHRAKVAMDNNATRALAFRMKKIADINDDAKRQKEARRMWRDIDTELKAYVTSAVLEPEIMRQARDLAIALDTGNITPDEFAKKSQQLHDLLNNACDLGSSRLFKIVDPFAGLRDYLREKMSATDKSIKGYFDAVKKKYLVDIELYQKAARLHEAAAEFSKDMNKTAVGGNLMVAADWVDNAFAVHDAYMAGKNPNEALWNASLAMGRIGLVEKWPALNIPFAVYDSCRAGDWKPAGMAVAFCYFPSIGQAYMLYQLEERAMKATKNAEFYDGLTDMLKCTEFDTSHRIVTFHQRHPVFGKIEHSIPVQPAGDRKAIINIFEEGSFSATGALNYWCSLIPSTKNRFSILGGTYETKLERLQNFFSQSEEVKFYVAMLKHYRGEAEKSSAEKSSADQLTSEQEATLDAMETQLRKIVWIAMADSLEAAAKSVDSPEMKEKIKEIETELALGDLTLGKGEGLQNRIDQEIYQSTGLINSIFGTENVYLLAPIYEKYIAAYTDIIETRNRILYNIWLIDHGIDYDKARQSPMKDLLLGGDKGVPSLVGEIDKDKQTADATLVRYEKRAKKIESDLKEALGREIDPVKDREHLKKLGQWAFEWEHLRDSCPGLSASDAEDFAVVILLSTKALAAWLSGSDADPAVLEAMSDRYKQYNEYLAKLKAALWRTLSVELKQQIESEQTEKPVKGAKVTIEAAEGQFKGQESLREEVGGKYEVEVLPGKYRLTASAQGFRAVDGEDEVVKELEIPLPEGEEKPKPVEETIYLSPVKGEIAVALLDMESKKSIPEAEVKLFPSKEPYEAFKKVRDDGRFTFEGLNPGKDYQIHAKADYYKSPVIRGGIILDTEDPSKSTPQPIQIELSLILSEVNVNAKNTFDQPLEGVSISLGDKADTTDDNGMVTFTNVPPSIDIPYDLTGEKEGYALVKKQIKVLPKGEGETFTKTIVMTPGGQITVTVRDGDGEPMPGADVHISGCKIGKTKTSDSSGSATFEELPIGFYYVGASKEGYLCPKDDVEVQITAKDLQKLAAVNLIEGVKVKVIILSEDGKPIRGKVTMDGGAQMFAPNGLFTFEGVTTEQEHTFTALADCYSEETKKYFPTSTPELQSIEIKIKPALTIRVVARDGSDGSLLKAPSQISLDGPEVRQGTGPVRLFSNLVKGSYIVGVSAEGYTDGIGSATISPEDKKCDHTLEILLKKVLANLSVSVALSGTCEAGEKPPTINISASGPGGSYSATGTSASFSGLTKGVYTASASATGYGSDSTIVQIDPKEAGQVYSASLILKKTEKSDEVVPAEEEEEEEEEEEGDGATPDESGTTEDKGLTAEVDTGEGGKTLHEEFEYDDGTKGSVTITAGKKAPELPSKKGSGADDIPGNGYHEAGTYFYKDKDGFWQTMPSDEYNNKKGTGGDLKDSKGDGIPDDGSHFGGRYYYTDENGKTQSISEDEYFEHTTAKGGAVKRPEPSKSDTDFSAKQEDPKTINLALLGDLVEKIKKDETPPDTSGGGSVSGTGVSKGKHGFKRDIDEELNKMNKKTKEKIDKLKKQKDKEQNDKDSDDTGSDTTTGTGTVEVATTGGGTSTGTGTTAGGASAGTGTATSTGGGGTSGGTGDSGSGTGTGGSGGGDSGTGSGSGTEVEVPTLGSVNYMFEGQNTIRKTFADIRRSPNWGIFQNWNNPELPYVEGICCIYDKATYSKWVNLSIYVGKNKNIVQEFLNRLIDADYTYSTSTKFKELDACYHTDSSTLGRSRNCWCSLYWVNDRFLLKVVVRCSCHDTDKPARGRPCKKISSICKTTAYEYANALYKNFCQDLLPNR